MILKRKGINLIISAPSGVGKSTMIKRLLVEDKNLVYSISATTRPKRDNEIDGVDYYFKSQEEFYKLITTNSFIEYAEVFGHFYGTLTKDITLRLQSGLDILFDLDWQGSTVLKNKMPEDTVGIFILPPSINELERRITSRGTDKKEVIAYRMAKSRSEIAHYSDYDYIIINDRLEEALKEIKAIILAHRLRRDKIINIDNFIHSL
ncbi:Guanylate kinase [Candidatus Hepatincolaceae symbiont of Richtersius coronifer]